MGPRLLDYGERPELDLHGCTVQQAIQLVRALIVEASKRGRDSVKLIHGNSTSDAGGKNSTIKNEIHRLLDDNRMPSHVSQCLKSTSHVIVGLRRRTGRVNRQPIKVRDLVHR